MNSIILIKFIVVFICILALVKGNLITLDGQCPFGDLKPAPVIAAALLDNATFLTRQTSLVFHAVAETAPLSGNNLTDISSILEHTKLPDNQLGGVKFIIHFRSKETSKCDQYEIIFKPTIQPGVYDLLYQVAPGADFVNYKGYILSYKPDIFLSVLFICHNLPNSEYQFEISVLSANSLIYNSQIQQETNKVLEENNLQYFAPYVTAINQQNGLDKNCLLV
ncbi:uncharacterized protein LOC123297433 isoform X1 [Chrysoperla carnea]|uniref:uncharacterized protein LOC123297433 isoform X1 n=1 Tax=Chrysoperla carnea TaxID=189513 RepID=UPI001D08B6B8|nr:uncharacterized protein LOC123297433 isoform X1 [Chrysoperla carnea]